MKFISSKHLLEKAIAIVQKAVAIRSTNPILEGILIEAEDLLTITGYNQEIGIETKIEEIEIIEKGSIVLNAKILGEIVRKLPETIVTIEVNEKLNVKIESENSLFNIKGLPAEEFPKIPEVEDTKKIKIEQNKFREMIKQTIFSAGIDESRPILKGLYLKSEGKEVEVVSTDGNRLSLRKEEIKEAADNIDFIVPGKTLYEVSRILENSEAEIEIYASLNHILFKIEKVKLVSRLIKGNFLNYRSILPKSFKSIIIGNSKTLLEALERAALFVNVDDRVFPITLKTKTEDILQIEANTDIGDAKEEIKIELKGEDIDMDFNPKFFLDILKVLPNEEIQLIFTGLVSPCIIKPLEGDAFLYLIQPLRR